MAETSGHLAAYRRAFGQNLSVPPGAIPSRLIAVVFTNRCGSMLFTEMIGSSPDIITRYEVFNGDVVANKSREHGLDGLVPYLRFLFGRERVTYTAKIHVGQLGFLAKMGLLDAFALGIEWFLVRREDEVAQAVSHSIARQTGQWTSHGGGEDRDPVYDFDEIRQIHRSIDRDHRRLWDLAGQLELPMQEIVFERFLAAPGDVLTDAWCRIGVRPGNITLDATRHRKQGTSLNAAFARRYRIALAGETEQGARVAV